jgi:hypothetical protein
MGWGVCTASTSFTSLGCGYIVCFRGSVVPGRDVSKWERMVA